MERHVFLIFLFFLLIFMIFCDLFFCDQVPRPQAAEPGWGPGLGGGIGHKIFRSKNFMALCVQNGKNIASENNNASFSIQKSRQNERSSYSIFAMGDFEHEYNFDDEDFFNDHWSERDWRVYLEKTDLQVSLFLNLFVSSRNIVNHMEHIAVQMGWTKETEGNFPDSFFRKDTPETIHTHPVTTVTRGLYHFLAKNWEIFLDASKMTDIKLCWLYAQLLNHGERNALYGISCMNAGDESLAVCHFKNALQILNLNMEVIQKIPKKTTKIEIIFHDALIACFDLREIWIKVMESCKNSDDDQDEDEEDEESEES